MILLYLKSNNTKRYQTDPIHSIYLIVHAHGSVQILKFNSVTNLISDMDKWKAQTINTTKANVTFICNYNFWNGYNQGL